MFKKLQSLVSELSEINSEKLEKGVYSQCKEARKILQEIKLASQDYRNLMTAYAKKDEKLITKFLELVQLEEFSDDKIEQEDGIPYLDEMNEEETKEEEPTKELGDDTVPGRPV